MGALFVLSRKNVNDSRWLLVLSSLALFWMSWLFVYGTYRTEKYLRDNPNPLAHAEGGMVRAMGGSSADSSSTTFEIALWRHPFIILIAALWPISRGSAAIAGDLDRGGLDLVLSRPIARSTYLSAQVLAAIFGLLVLAAALTAGNQVANRFNFIEGPPALATVLRPAMNFFALGFALFGLTMFFSSYDLVRWRPMLLGATVTLLCYIATVIASLPDLPDWKWLEKLSIFTLYDPVEAAIKGVRLGFNAGVLASIGAAGLVLSYLVFGVRDLLQ